jgi:hypothetical protein
MFRRVIPFMILVSVNCAHGQDANLQRIVGGWVNDDNSLAILKTQLGWDVWIDNKGRARITTTGLYGANIMVTTGDATGDLKCFYYASVLVGGNQMIWQLQSGGAGNCPNGTFTRTDDDSYGSVLKGLLASKRPASGRWNLSASCPNNAHFNVLGTTLRGGRYADGSLTDTSGSIFDFDVSASFTSDTSLHLSGFASNLQFFDFEGTKQSDGVTYSGGGKWNGNNCGFTAKYLGPLFPDPLIQVTRSDNITTWDLSLQCGDNVSSNYKQVKFINGRAAAGFTYKDDNVNGINEWVLFSTGSDTISLTGYRLTANEVSKIDVTASKSPDGSPGVRYIGTGSFGSESNCHFEGRTY